jgi:hypothetical protein
LLVLLYARLDAPLGVSGDGPAGEDGRGPGCLVVNTAIELGPHDDQARDVVAASLDALRSAVGWLVDEAVAAGEIDAGIDRELATDQDLHAAAGSERLELRRR